jgi:hypothetical protein
LQNRWQHGRAEGDVLNGDLHAAFGGGGATCTRQDPPPPRTGLSDLLVGLISSFETVKITRQSCVCA